MSNDLSEQQYAVPEQHEAGLNHGFVVHTAAVDVPVQPAEIGADHANGGDWGDLDTHQDGAGGESSDTFYRLFVGWIPNTYTEEELKPYFEKYGIIRDIVIMVDKPTGKSKGCAFVCYNSKQEAERAIQNMDRKVTLPSGVRALEVRFARNASYIKPSEGPADNKMLFFSRGPPGITEVQVRSLFGKYGKITHVNLFPDRKSGTTKGCGFVEFENRDDAHVAMEALGDKHVIPGGQGTLNVKWADLDLQVKKRKAMEELDSGNRQLYFAKVPKDIDSTAIGNIFEQYGPVEEVTLFRTNLNASASKGCGLVMMGSREAAKAALEALDGQYSWEGMQDAMVVKWMDSELQKKRKAGAEPQGMRSRPGFGPPGRAGFGSGPNSMPVSYQNVPPGCAPDAIQLFVGNIPTVYDDESLKTFFAQVGQVVNLLLLRHRDSGQPKGSAFVWFRTRQEAMRAMQRFNGQHALKDPTQKQNRPLQVMPAKPKEGGGRSFGGQGAGGGGRGQDSYGGGGMDGGYGGMGMGMGGGMNNMGMMSGGMMDSGMGMGMNPMQSVMAMQQPMMPAQQPVQPMQNYAMQQAMGQQGQQAMYQPQQPTNMGYGMQPMQQAGMMGMQQQPMQAAPPAASPAPPMQQAYMQSSQPQQAYGQQPQPQQAYTNYGVQPGGTDAYGQPLQQQPQQQAGYAQAGYAASAAAYGVQPAAQPVASQAAQPYQYGVQQPVQQPQAMAQQQQYLGYQQPTQAAQPAQPGVGAYQQTAVGAAQSYPEAPAAAYPTAQAYSNY